MRGFRRPVAGRTSRLDLDKWPNLETLRLNPAKRCQPMSTGRLFGQLIEVDGEQAGYGCLPQSALNGG